MLCITFPGNGFNFITEKFTKNWKMSYKRSEHSFLSSKYFENQFLKILVSPTLNSNDLGGSVFLSQKMISTSSLKNSQKLKNVLETLRTFICDLKVASKPFSTKLLLTKFCLKNFERLVPFFHNTVSTSSLENFQKT